MKNADSTFRITVIVSVLFIALYHLFSGLIVKLCFVLYFYR